jgi:hypothetical protein
MIKARLFAAGGVPLIRSSGLMLCPLHVYFAGISAPVEKAGLVIAIPELDPLDEFKTLSVTNDIIMLISRQFIAQ